MRAQGLIKGAALENALVFSEQGFVNTPRMLHEPVWHKALDFLGDLYLAGRPYRGHFLAHRGSHRLHVELAKLLQT
jgi:UDP-3-O-[3-hydroxymyristoyl] N-acetylglucosamine deacetylase